MIFFFIVVLVSNWDFYGTTSGMLVDMIELFYDQFLGYIFAVVILKVQSLNMHANPYTMVLLKLDLGGDCIVGDSMIKVFNFLIIHIYSSQWMYYVCICNDKIFQLSYQNKMLEKAKIYMIRDGFALWK